MSNLYNNILKVYKVNLTPRSVLYNINAFCSNNSSNNFLLYEKDPGPAFINPDTQKLLTSITRVQLDKVFRKRSVPNSNIAYKFMTTEQVQSEVRYVERKAKHLLQMPPIVKIIEDDHQVISNDTGLKMFSDSSYVFTDITYGLKSMERKIVVRHPDGTLEKAPLSVRKRMNQIYFPLNGRKMLQPRMFEDEHLMNCLNERKYEFVLDRLCLQFEPYEKVFHEISSKIYLHINENKCFDDLRSTRHFGPMTFFLAWHKLIDDLLFDMIKRDFLKNGVELIILMFNLNGNKCDKNVLTQLDGFTNKNSIDLQYKILQDNNENNNMVKTSDDFKADDICLEFITKYTKENAIKKTQLELILQTYKENHEEMKRLSDGLKKAHGAN